MRRTATTRKIVRHGLAHVALALIVASTPMGHALAQERTLMLYGDSLMAGFGLPPHQGFASQLQEALGDEVRIINASVSGDTSADGLARLDWSLAERPDAAIVELGANDMLQGLPVDAMEQNLTAILERFAAEDIPVLLAGMRASPGLGSDYVAAYDAVFPELAATFDTDFYPFFLEGVAIERTLNQSDGIHPNGQGVNVIVEAMLPMIEDLLER